MHPLSIMTTPVRHLFRGKLSIGFYIIVLVILTDLTKQSLQLECYVCQNQENNKNKCVETSKICDITQDQCLTEVRWGSTPYWALTGQKQYYISKKCAQKSECQNLMSDKNHKCDRIWYNDWNCTSCCNGDRCNYYVTLGASSKSPSIALMALCAILVFASKLNLLKTSNLIA